MIFHIENYMRQHELIKTSQQGPKQDRLTHIKYDHK